MICTRHYGQLERVHMTAELLRQFRFGCRLTNINREISERFGEPVCERTTRRDLEFLEVIGVVEVDQPEAAGRNTPPPRYSWAPSRPLMESRPARRVAAG